MWAIIKKMRKAENSDLQMDRKRADGAAESDALRGRHHKLLT